MTDCNPRWPELIGMIGDGHGDVRWYLDVLDRLAHEGVAQVVQLGDFGVVWTGRSDQVGLDRINARLKRHGMRMLVVEGNHENYSALAREWPHDRAGIRHLGTNLTMVRHHRAVTHGGVRLAFLGGANSIDRWDRNGPGVQHAWLQSWWPEEQITDNDLRRLGPEPADILFGHDAPDSPELADRLAHNGLRWAPRELEYARAGQQMFERGVRQLGPRLVVSGHYHVRCSGVFDLDLDGAHAGRSEVMNCAPFPGAFGVLDTCTLQITDLELDPARKRNK